MNHVARYAVSEIARTWLQGWDHTRAVVSALYLLLYVLLDWVSSGQPAFDPAITLWNPQAGLTLAFLLSFGSRYMIVTAIGAALAEMLVREASALSPVVLLASAWIALSYGTLASVLQQWRLAGEIATPAACARLIVASLIGTLIVNSGYILLFTTAGELPPTDVTTSIARYWLGDLIGIVTLTPLLLQSSRWHEGVRAVSARAWEVSAQFAAIVLSLWLLFGLTAFDELRVFYALFVPTLWIAWRWGLPGALLGPLAIQIGLVIFAQGASQGPPLLDQQFLMLALSLAALLLGSVVTERAEELRRAAMREAEQRALIATEVSDRRRAETQLREREMALAHAMRFAVAGELASVLTHELDQPITALAAYLRASEILAAPYGHQDDRIRATLGKAAEEALHASEVLHRLRDFYRGGAMKREVIHLPVLCSAVSTAFHDRLRRANIALIVRMDPSLPTIEGDRTLLEVVLHNLVDNSIEALTQVARPWRRIEISGACEEGSVVLHVADSGPGIDPDIVPKLFEPFTTSKSDGMGLGLAISRSLIRAGGGDLTVQPHGKLGGACFLVRLI